MWGRHGEILHCPWHGWECDLTTGRAICEPDRTRVRTYEVTVEPAELLASAVETYPVTEKAVIVILHV